MNRRTFLHSSAALSALAALPTFSIRAAEKSGGRKFRTAPIGCGWWRNTILPEARGKLLRYADITAAGAGQGVE